MLLQNGIDNTESGDIMKTLKRISMQIKKRMMRKETRVKKVYTNWRNF